jgi:hypothetical protein
VLALTRLAADARERAADHLQWGDRGIFMAKIDARSLEPSTLPLRFGHGTVRLPAWECRYGGPTFVSTSDVRRLLGVRVTVSQLSEWFALDYIPTDMIPRITTFERRRGGWIEEDWYLVDLMDPQVSQEIVRYVFQLKFDVELYNRLDQQVTTQWLCSMAPLVDGFKLPLSCGNIWTGGVGEFPHEPRSMPRWGFSRVKATSQRTRRTLPGILHSTRHSLCLHQEAESHRSLAFWILNPAATRTMCHKATCSTCSMFS